MPPVCTSPWVKSNQPPVQSRPNRSLCLEDANTFFFVVQSGTAINAGLEIVLRQRQRRRKPLEHSAFRSSLCTMNRSIQPAGFSNLRSWHLSTAAARSSDYSVQFWMTKNRGWFALAGKEPLDATINLLSDACDNDRRLNRYGNMMDKVDQQSDAH